MSSVEPNTSGDKNSGEIFRLRIQMETMLLGWIRTSLALMGFGFVLARFGLFLREVASVSEILIKSHRWLALTNTFTGTILILLGVIVLLISMVSHRRAVIRLERGDLGKPGQWSLGMTLCLILAAMGMGMAIYLTAVEI
jgi:putative membrane protein